MTKRDKTLLREYLDTGLSPDNLREIDILYQEKCEELAAARKTLEKTQWLLQCRERQLERIRGKLRDVVTLSEDEPDPCRGM